MQELAGVEADCVRVGLAASELTLYGLAWLELLRTRAVSSDRIASARIRDMCM